MSSLESLPPDQRAVLTLVLQRGRSYDEIASMLSIERAAVRDRALAALDALGPSTRVPAPQRALITDDLLGQLPERVEEQVRENLASSASERVWARVLAGELAPIASKALPEIPASQAAAEPKASQEATGLAEPAPELAAAISAATAETKPQGQGRGLPQPVPGARASSRRGGTILLVLAGLIVVAVVVIVIVANSGSNTNTTATKASTTPAGTTAGTTTGTSTTPHLVAQINLHPPSASSKAVGIADVVTEGKLTALVVAAAHLPPNTRHNAYAVWLSSSGGTARLLGYVSPGVGKNGDLKTTGQLPTNAASFNEVLITLETTTNTKTPGPTVLQGALALNGG